MDMALFVFYAEVLTRIPIHMDENCYCHSKRKISLMARSNKDTDEHNY